MTRQITGTLKNPDGTSMARAELKFTSYNTTSGASHIIKGSSSTETCNAAGVYDITLEDGEYQVSYTYNGETHLLSQRLVVTAGAASDLGALLA